MRKKETYAVLVLQGRSQMLTKEHYNKFTESSYKRLGPKIDRKISTVNCYRFSDPLKWKRWYIPHSADAIPYQEFGCRGIW